MTVGEIFCSEAFNSHAAAYYNLHTHLYGYMDIHRIREPEERNDFMKKHLYSGKFYHCLLISGYIDLIDIHVY